MKTAALFDELELLQIENRGLRVALEKDAERLKNYDEEVSRLYEIIRKFKREIYGPRKERWLSREQLTLFNEAEVESRKPDSRTQDEIEVRGYKRGRGKRKPLPLNLPREVVVIDLPESEKVAPDGSPLRVMGKEVSEKLICQPATMKVIEYHRLKYGGAEGKDTVKIAPMPPSIIPKSIVTPSLLSYIVTNKYADGLPLYRQEERFARQGIDIPRSSMGRWIVKGSEACQGVWNALEERLMASFYVSCDETHTQVLKEEGRPAEAKSWMWVRTTPADEKKIVLFDYDPSRSGDVAKRLFVDYKGYLQCDGYGGYNQLEKQKDIKRFGCNMHGRRKFFDASEGAEKGQPLAHQGLDFYSKLYAIERHAEKLSSEERFLLRNKEASPIWDEMKVWAEAKYGMVPPKSKIGQAFHYFLGEYHYLRGYLQDGRLEIDNGFAERAIKYFAIGRNNWLFSDTVEGAEASSMFYSFVITAKLNKVNPFDALEMIFTEVPLAKTAEDYERIAEFLLTPKKR